MSKGSSLNVQIHKQEMLRKDDRLLVPASPQKTSSCSDLFARLSPARRGRGQPVSLALVWERRAQGATQMPGWAGAGGGGPTALWSACSARAPPHRHASCRQQTGPALRARGEGQVKSKTPRAGGTYSCSREASPLKACRSIAWISFLYR